MCLCAAFEELDDGVGDELEVLDGEVPVFVEDPDEELDAVEADPLDVGAGVGDDVEDGEEPELRLALGNPEVDEDEEVGAAVGAVESDVAADVLPG